MVASTQRAAETVTSGARPSHRSQMNSPSQARFEGSKSSTSLTGESHSDATDSDASVACERPHIHELPE